MELITDVKQFIDGKGYYCKNKITGKISINYVYNDNGNRYFSKSKYWLNDEENARKIFKIQDIIGPIPEIKEDIIQGIFEYPKVLNYFTGLLTIREDGSIYILDEDVLDIENTVNFNFEDKDDITILMTEGSVGYNSELYNDKKALPFKLNEDGNPILSDFQFKDDIKYKVGNYIKLKTDLHNEVGCFPEGSVLKIKDKYNNGYIVGNDYMEVFASKDCFDIIIIHS